MDAKEFREMNVDELAAKRRELKEQKFHLRLNRAAGRLENSMKMRQARRDLARLETILREKTISGVEANSK